MRKWTNNSLYFMYADLIIYFKVLLIKIDNCVLQVKSLTQFAVDLGFLIEEYAGSRGKIPPRKRKKKKSLYIATIEKVTKPIVIKFKYSFFSIYLVHLYVVVPQ